MDDPVGHVLVHLVEELESVRLLAFVAVRVAGQAIVPAELPDRFAVERAHVVEARRGHDHHGGAAGVGLDHLGPVGPRGDHHDAAQACGRGVGGHRSRGVPRGRHGDGIEAQFHRPGNAHGVAAVLEGPGGEQRVVLDVEPPHPHALAQPRATDQRGIAFAQGHHRAAALHREEVEPAPEGPVAAGADVAQVGPGEAPQVHADLQHAAAVAAREGAFGDRLPAALGTTQPGDPAHDAVNPRLPQRLPTGLPRGGAPGGR